MASPDDKKDITIIGGGIIGCCTAYFLTRHPSYDPERHRITLLEASHTNAGGRVTPDGKPHDPASLLDNPSLNVRNPAHDGIAGGASGKAGGLLALWAFPSNIVPLSFRLHQELAKEHGGEGRWGYRRCFASQVECRARKPSGLTSSSATNDNTGAPQESIKGLHKDHRKTAASLKKLGAPEDLDWLDTENSLDGYVGMGTPDDTAQVHPELFTRAMAAMAEEKGVKIITGARATSIDMDANGAVQSISYVTGEASSSSSSEEHKLPTTNCIVAAGPWTARLLPSVPVTSSRAHSVVIKTPQTVSPYALFTSIRLPTGFRAPTTGKGQYAKKPVATLQRPNEVEPEIYARPDSTAYACGTTDSAVPLPRSNAEVEVDLQRADDVAAQVGAISDELATKEGGAGAAGAGALGEVLARQACYLPQGGPYIGPVDEEGMKGVLVAAGHTCWGIQNAPGTGKLVSELVFEGKATSARLGGCDPRFAL